MCSSCKFKLSELTRMQDEAKSEQGCGVAQKLSRGDPSTAEGVDESTHAEGFPLVYQAGWVHAREPHRMASPLHTAVMGGSVACLEAVLAAGADVAAVNVMGLTALAAAVNLAVAGGGRGRMVEMLLQHGSDPDGGSYCSTTPIMAAVREGRTDLVELLVGAGAATSPSEAVLRCASVPAWPLQHALAYSSYPAFLALLKGGASTRMEGLLRATGHFRCLDSFKGHLSKQPQFRRAYREFGGAATAEEEEVLSLQSHCRLSLLSHCRLSLLARLGQLCSQAIAGTPHWRHTLTPAQKLEVLADSVILPTNLKDFLKFTDLNIIQT